MTEIAHIGIAADFAGLGVVLGLVHLKLLSWNIRALVGRLHGLLGVGASFGRAVLTVAAFLFAVFHGATALVATLAGFLLSRAILLRKPGLLLP